MSQPSRTPTLFGQAATCGLMLALAVITTLALQAQPYFAAWIRGGNWMSQVGVAIAFAAAAAVASLMVLAAPKLRQMMPVPEALKQINLRGMRPVAIGIFAGVGEEALFRAALQPVLGLWLGAAVFAIAHIRTAAFSTQVSWKQLVYMINVFFAGIALGLVYEYVGLLAAILIHATIDVAALVVARGILVSATVADAA